MIRKSNEQTLGEVISDLLQAYRLEGRLDEMEIIRVWDEVAGKMIQNHTKNLYVNRGTLYVSLDSAALRHELNMSKSKIIKALNKKVGKEVISEIVFR